MTAPAPPRIAVVFSSATGNIAAMAEALAKGAAGDGRTGSRWAAPPGSSALRACQLQGARLALIARRVAGRDA